MNIEGMGRMLLVMALITFLLGGIFVIGGKIGLGRLPGDIYIKKGNFSFYFPIITCVIVSLLITFILNIVSKR